jgi:uncharacterized membrane protein
MCYNYFVKFIFWNVIFLSILSGIVFLVVFLDCYLLVFKNKIDLYIFAYSSCVAGITDMH